MSCLLATKRDLELGHYRRKEKEGVVFLFDDLEREREQNAGHKTERNRELRAVQREREAREERERCGIFSLRLYDLFLEIP